MYNDAKLPGVFKLEHLYSMVRSYCLAIAPFPLKILHAPAVINAFISDNTALAFSMSEDIPPVFTGQNADTFSAYLKQDEKTWPPEGSVAWYTVQFMRIQTTNDLTRMESYLDATVKWMAAAGYFTGNTESGFLPTQKLLDEISLKIKRRYGD